MMRFSCTPGQSTRVDQGGSTCLFTAIEPPPTPNLPAAPVLTHPPPPPLPCPLLSRRYPPRPPCPLSSNQRKSDLRRYAADGLPANLKRSAWPFRRPHFPTPPAQQRGQVQPWWEQAFHQGFHQGRPVPTKGDDKSIHSPPSKKLCASLSTPSAGPTRILAAAAARLESKVNIVLSSDLFQPRVLDSRLRRSRVLPANVLWPRPIAVGQVTAERAMHASPGLPFSLSPPAQTRQDDETMVYYIAGGKGAAPPLCIGNNARRTVRPTATSRGVSPTSALPFNHRHAFRPLLCSPSLPTSVSLALAFLCSFIAWVVRSFTCSFTLTIAGPRDPIPTAEHAMRASPGLSLSLSLPRLTV